MRPSPSVSISRSIRSTVSVLFTGQVITWISSFVLLMVLPRMLGSIDYGRLFLALSIKEILSMVIEYGGTHLIPKEIARRKEGREEFIGHQAMVRMSLWSISLIGVFASAALFKESRLVLALVLVLLIGTAFETLAKVLRAYYQGIESMRIPVIGQVVERFVVTSLAVTFLLLGGGSMVIALVFAFGSLVHLGVVQRLGRDIVQLRPRLGSVFGTRYGSMSSLPDFMRIRPRLGSVLGPRPHSRVQPPSQASRKGGTASSNPQASRKSGTASSKLEAPSAPSFRSAMGVATPYFLWSVFSVLYYRIDAVMLTQMQGEQVTGWYGAAVRFFDAVMILPMLFRVAIYPIFSRLVDGEPSHLEILFEKSVRVVLLGSIPIGVLLYLHAGGVIDLFMGLGEYLPSVFILQMFALSVPVMFVDFILGSAVLGAADLQRRWAWVGALAILANILLNLWLIPVSDEWVGNPGVGAALATLLTELMILTSAIVLLPRHFFSRFSPGLYARILLLGVLCVGVGVATQQVPAHWMLQAGLTGGIFIVLTLWTGVLHSDEIHLVKSSVTAARDRLLRSLRSHSEGVRARQRGVR